MKKVLVLGSDFGTLSVVKEAHKQGDYVIVADLMPSSPSKDEADEAWLVSTIDINELENRCRRSGVDAIMFGASDFNISNCRILCNRLGLPIYCNDDAVWERVRNKRVFKEICKEVGAPIATDYILSDSDFQEKASQIQYPVVVKPSDKSGNRGMSYCDNSQELIAGYKTVREISEKSVIVERRLVGEEFNVHYALADGEASLLYFSSTHHQPGFPPNLYSFKCTTSCHLKQYIDEVDALAIQVIKRMGCRDGIAWFDVMRDRDGKFYLLEMGFRFGGVMTYVPYQKVSGFNTVKWMLDLSCGINHQKADLPAPLGSVQKALAASYHLFTLRAGTVSQLRGLETIEQMKDVYVDIPKREGATVRGLSGMGLIGIYGDDVEDLCAKVQQINKQLVVKDQDGEDLIIKYNDIESLKREYYNGLADF